MVGFAAPPSPEEIKRHRIANYTHHKTLSETAELNDDRWALYMHLRTANRYASWINESDYPLLDVTATLSQFTSVDKLQALCLDFHGRDTNAEYISDIKNTLANCRSMNMREF